MSVQMWLHLLYQYEMLCYDLGCEAIDDLSKKLNDWWEHL